MEKHELMRSMFGEHQGQCWDCHFCHWKIEGKGDNRRLGYVWCEVYGIDKEDIAQTAWSRQYPACGLYNLCQDPPRKQIYKYVKKDRRSIPAGQMSLF